MATTNEEYLYVHNHEELQRTVQSLVQRGGVVQDQRDDEVVLYIKKKMNVVVLIVGLLLCLVPGLAYLIWYLTADQNQLMHVKIGAAPNLGGYHPEDEFDAPVTGSSVASGSPSSGAPSAGSSPVPPPAAIPAQDSSSQIPTMPSSDPATAPVADPVQSTPQPAPPPPSTAPPESF